MKVEWADHDLDTVIDFWVKHYEIPQGQMIARHEYFVDPVKKRVVLRLIIDDGK